MSTLIRSYTVDTSLSVHHTDHLEYEAIVTFDSDLSPVLPYLNATLSNAVYSPHRPALAWVYEDHKVGFWPDRIAIDHLHSKDEVYSVVQSLVELVNDTWRLRHEIEPMHAARKVLKPLEIHALLPQTNCKACGEDTCFNFALKLVAQQVDLGACKPLIEEGQYVDMRNRIVALIESIAPSG